MKIEIVLHDEAIQETLNNGELGLLLETIGEDINLAMKTTDTSEQTLSEDVVADGEPIGRWTVDLEKSPQIVERPSVANRSISALNRFPCFRNG